MCVYMRVCVWLCMNEHQLRYASILTSAVSVGVVTPHHSGAAGQLRTTAATTMSSSRPHTAAVSSAVACSSGLRRTAPAGDLTHALQQTTAADRRQVTDDESQSDVRMPPLSGEQLRRVPSPLRQKHSLRDAWTFWYRVCSAGCWQSSQRRAVTVDSVEDFWAAVHSLQPVGQLTNGTDCSLFKRHIQPMWEDRHCQNGGRWVFALERCSRASLQQLWVAVMLAVIGGALEEQCGDFVCGAVVSVRGRGDRLSVWTSEVGSKRVDLLKTEVLSSTALAPNTSVYFEEFGKSNSSDR